MGTDIHAQEDLLIQRKPARSPKARLDESADDADAKEDGPQGPGQLVRDVLADAGNNQPEGRQDVGVRGDVQAFLRDNLPAPPSGAEPATEGATRQRATREAADLKDEHNQRRLHDC